jgi:hypothetical protein
MSRPGRANRMSIVPSLDAMLSASFGLLLSVETSSCTGQIHVLRNGPQVEGGAFPCQAQRQPIPAWNMLWTCHLTDLHSTPQ